VRTGRVCRGWCGIGGLLRFRRFRRFRFPCLERVRLRRQRLPAMRSPLEIGDASRHANLAVGYEGPGEGCFEITAMDRPAHLPECAKTVLSEADHDCVLCVGSGSGAVGLAHCSFCGSFSALCRILVGRLGGSAACSAGGVDVASLIHPTHDLSFGPAHAVRDAVVSSLRNEGAGRVGCAVGSACAGVAASLLRVSSRAPDWPFLPARSSGVRVLTWANEPPGALAPSPLAGSSCQAWVRFPCLDPPVGPRRQCIRRSLRLATRAGQICHAPVATGLLCNIKDVLQRRRPRRPTALTS
jgi:hypothetical protein